MITFSVIDEAAERFADAGFDLPDGEARALLAGLLGWSSAQLLAHPDVELTEPQRELFEKAVERRLQREPVAYILGQKNFMGYDFDVDSRVLIPRPETELLAEQVNEEIKSKNIDTPKILDIGTGSGCIAISLALLQPKSQIVAVDSSLSALKIAMVNARKHSVEGRLSLLLGDLFNDLRTEETGRFDIIVSNPPYVATSVMNSLQPELSFEPRAALDGGHDGLDIIRRLVAQSPNFLKDQGKLFLEIGYDQSVQVQNLMYQSGFQNISVIKDYSGHDRIVKGTI